MSAQIQDLRMMSPAPRPMTGSDLVTSLNGRRLLIVEDEYLLAMGLTDLLQMRGALVVGPAANVTTALELIEREAIDIALLDVNLGGELVFPAADLLRARGVPIVFMSGYERNILPERHQAAPHCVKPLDVNRIEQALLQACAPAARG